jgi:hypothetical protein
MHSLAPLYIAKKLLLSSAVEDACMEHDVDRGTETPISSILEALELEVKQTRKTPARRGELLDRTTLAFVLVHE